jgi:hypothetical protein
MKQKLAWPAPWTVTLWYWKRSNIHFFVRNLRWLSVPKIFEHKHWKNDFFFFSKLEMNDHWMFPWTVFNFCLDQLSSNTNVKHDSINKKAFPQKLQTWLTPKCASSSVLKLKQIYLCSQLFHPLTGLTNLIMCKRFKKCIKLAKTLHIGKYALKNKENDLNMNFELVTLKR